MRALAERERVERDVAERRELLRVDLERERLELDRCEPDFFADDRRVDFWADEPRTDFFTLDFFFELDLRPLDFVAMNYSPVMHFSFETAGNREWLFAQTMHLFFPR